MHNLAVTDNEVGMRTLVLDVICKDWDEFKNKVSQWVASASKNKLGRTFWISSFERDGNQDMP